MQAGKVATKIRLRVGDMQKTRFSDYEILSALNDAMSMLWVALAENFSRIPQKTVNIVMTDGKAPLPEDYYSLVKKPAGAEIRGMEITGAEGELVYNAVPIPALDMADDIRLPLSLLLDCVEVAGAIATGRTDEAASIAGTAARRISQKREISEIPDRVPFP